MSSLCLTSRLLTILSLSLVVSACSIPDTPKGADRPALTLLGDRMRERGDDVAAADFYDRALQQNPTDLKARLALASLFEMHGDVGNASQEYRKSLSQEADNKDALRGLGRVLLRTNQPEEAKQQFMRLLEQDEDDVKAMNGLGVALDYEGHHHAAQDVYKKALAVNENDMGTLNNLAHSFVLVGAYEEARKLLETHIKDKGATPTLRQNLAEAYGLMGMDADALRLALIDLPPDEARASVAAFRRKREKLVLAPKNYADLGAFATPQMAEARSELLKERFGLLAQGLATESLADIKAIGGTPSFNARVVGFASIAKAVSFCEKLGKINIPCQAKAK